MIDQTVEIELIRATAFIIPSVLTALTYFKTSKTGTKIDVAVAKVDATHDKLVDVAHAVDGLTTARVQAAGDLEHALGKEEGVKEERVRNGDSK